MSDAARIVVATGAGERALAIDDLVSTEIAERAESEANAWIKQLRHARVDGATLRDRFTMRGDSLWWFAELYLHKRRIVARAFRTLRALQPLAAERPVAWRVDRADGFVGHVAHAVANARGFPCSGHREARPRSSRLATEAKAIFHTATALADRLRPTASPRGDRPVVAAFVHSAFARGSADDETYLGPLLRELRGRLGESALHLVGLGPRTNFRVRRWRDRAREFADPGARGLPLTPVDSYARWQDLAPSLAQWRARGEVARALRASADLRAAAIVDGCDLWELLAPELDGIADLQFPWSARAMDEAGAALDRLEPRSIVTYAEAGGWGRAIVLESRRRGIPSVGLQHGFIYRHWLNYLHEPDEMAADPANRGDRGFPKPTRTLVFDDYAASHLREAGRFNAESLAVTGSPRLDSLATGVQTLSAEATERAKAEAGAGSRTLVLVTTKHREARAVLRTFLDAATSVRDVHVAIKTHPAETPEAYSDLVAAQSNVTVVPASAPLAPLLRASRAVVTVNSTVALDAAVLGLPALVIGLPNNLSPFVDAGIMAGVSGRDAGEIARALDQILYDEEFRQRLRTAQRAFLARFHIQADGNAAERAADVIVQLATDD
jgi:Capsule polysaccharide biosynthesis protein